MRVGGLVLAVLAVAFGLSEAGAARADPWVAVTVD
jgi:hypothetical protein